jgi:hypothetical protein
MRAGSVALGVGLVVALFGRSQATVRGRPYGVDSYVGLARTRGPELSPPFNAVTFSNVKARVLKSKSQKSFTTKKRAIP